MFNRPADDFDLNFENSFFPTSFSIGNANLCDLKRTLLKIFVKTSGLVIVKKSE